MHKSGIGVFAGLLASAICVAGASAKDATPFFDKPLKVVRVKLPPDPDNPQSKPEVRCSYYPGFAVKEIDLGEEGDFQLSIVQGEDFQCRKQNASNEKIIASRDWSGYFAGVYRDYIFFDADDGWNDGMGFAVFNREGRKLFEDVAKDWAGISLIAVPGPTGVASRRALALRYRRVYEAKCSLAGAHPAECWQTIQRETGLTGAAPECMALYAKEQKRTPREAKQVLDDPTVIDYDVATTLAANGVHMTQVQQTPLKCRPAE
jgi:hypothetical protein